MMKLQAIETTENNLALVFQEPAGYSLEAVVEDLAQAQMYADFLNVMLDVPALSELSDSFLESLS